MNTLLGLAVGKDPRDAAIKATLAAFRPQFSNPHITSNYLFRTLFPPSQKWVYKPCAKTGTSSVLRHLFELEFQTKLTVKTTPENDMNPSHEFHMLANARVFGRALEYGYSLPDLLDQDQFGERIVMARNPYDRVISAYRYFCLSQTKQSRWFELERIRITALTGFDWQVHPTSPKGFDLFLAYIEHEMRTVGPHHVNEHWRPQYDVVQPTAFQPTLLGRLEDPKGFAKALAQTLGKGLDTGLSHENKTGPKTAKPDLSASQKAQIEALYQDDFEYFSY